MEIYGIDIGYADSSKVLWYVSKVSKMRKSELIDCLVNKNGNLISIKNVRSLHRKRALAQDRVASCFLFYF